MLLFTRTILVRVVVFVVNLTAVAILFVVDLLALLPVESSAIRGTVIVNLLIHT